MNKRFKLFAVVIIVICTLVSFIYWNNREESSDVITPTEAPQPIEVALSPEPEPEPTTDSSLDAELESLLPPPLTEREIRDQIRRQEYNAYIQAKLLEIETESTYETVKNIMYKDVYQYIHLYSNGIYSERVMEEPRMKKLHQLLSTGDEAIRKEIFDSIRTMANVYLNELPLYTEPGERIIDPTANLPGGAAAYALLLGEFDTKNATLPLLVSMHEHNQYAIKQERLQAGEEEKEYVYNSEAHLFAEGVAMMLDRIAQETTLRSQLTPHQNEVLKEYEVFKSQQEKAFREFMLQHYEAFNIPVEERTQVDEIPFQFGSEKKIYYLAKKFINN